MTCLALAVALGCLSAADVAAAAAVPSPWASPLTLSRLGAGDRPDLVLAQRSIEREWPVAGDSGVLVLQGGRSEIGALAMSAAVPGAGQIYAGQVRGIYFAAAEVVGWIGWALLRRGADDLRGDARALAGTPDDSASAWSFDRLEDATAEDTAYLRALYAADRDAFDQAIAGDPRYAPGWSSAQAREEFSDLRRRSDRKRSHSRAAEGALWVNHVVAAIDALRAARLHNVPIGRGVELKADGGWRRGRPAFTVALERRF